MNLIALSRQIVKRSQGSSDLLTKEELKELSYKDIREVGRSLSNTNIVLSIKVQDYYYKNRKRTSKQLLDETQLQIKEYEDKYHNNFETVFGHIKSHQLDDMEHDEYSDYDDWKELLLLKNELSKKIKAS